MQICLESKGCLVFFFHIQFIPFIYIIYIYIQLMYSNLNVSVTQYVWRWKVKKFCWLVKRSSHQTVEYLTDCCTIGKETSKIWIQFNFHFSKPLHSNTRNTHGMHLLHPVLLGTRSAPAEELLKTGELLKSWEFPQVCQPVTSEAYSAAALLWHCGLMVYKFLQTSILHC